MSRISGSIVIVGLLLAACAGGAEPQAEMMEPTVITSRTLMFDYRRSVALFEDDVVVVDPQIRMEADRLNVFFDSTNDVKSVTAAGNVRIWHQDKTAVADKAIYMSKTGEIILQGNAKVSRGNDVVAGNEITFWLNEDRMICKPGHVVFYPKKEGDRDPMRVLRTPVP